MFADKIVTIYSVCVASAVRIVMMDQLVKSPDFTWAMSKVFIWSCCEPFIGIVCACLPTYAPLVRRWWTASHSRRDYRSGETPQRYYEKHNDSSGSNDSRRARRYGHAQGLDGSTFQGDDEFELTTAVSSPAIVSEVPRAKGRMADSVQYKPDREIMVRHDIVWSTNV